MNGWEVVPKHAESEDMTPPIFLRKKQIIFSKRESEILTLLTQGMTNKEIAVHLYISTETVKTHVAHILRKLSARNRTEAAIKATAFKTKTFAYSLPTDLSLVNFDADEDGSYQVDASSNLSGFTMKVK